MEYDTQTLVHNYLLERFPRASSATDLNVCHLVTDLGLDSLDIAELCFELEEASSVRVPESKILSGEVMIVKELIGYIDTTSASLKDTT